MKVHWTSYFYPGFWQYVFEPVKTRYNDERFYQLRVWWCRLRGHPSGIVFYNPSGYEPDYTCKGCGEDLG